MAGLQKATNWRLFAYYAKNVEVSESRGEGDLLRQPVSEPGPAVLANVNGNEAQIRQW